MGIRLEIPFYCDNRKTLSYPELRDYVKFEIIHVILDQFPEVEAIAGVATGAIPGRSRCRRAELAFRLCSQ